ncbi:MAG: hypothetical protein QOJ01_2010 [Solirubrobacterales bacterium]|jgi:hypothetical protein|nr:hypothetical protein [Solirubrobacterales bacterium]
MSGGAAQTWFIAGTVPLMLGGGLHALATLRDTVRPTFFAPIDASVKPALEGTGIRLRRMFPGGSGAHPSMWKVWLGINISHGLGVFTVGLLCLLIATHDFKLVESIGPIRPLAIAFSAAYLALSLRFWFYGPAILCASATTCFTVATVLSL